MMRLTRLLLCVPVLSTLWISGGTAAEARSGRGGPGDLFFPPPPDPQLRPLPPIMPSPEAGSGALAGPSTGWSDWMGPQPGERGRHKVKRNTEAPWGSVTAETILRAPEPPRRDAPFERG